MSNLGICNYSRLKIPITWLTEVPKSRLLHFLLIFSFPPWDYTRSLKKQLVSKVTSYVCSPSSCASRIWMTCTLHILASSELEGITMYLCLYESTCYHQFRAPFAHAPRSSKGYDMDLKFTQYQTRVIMWTWTKQNVIIAHSMTYKKVTGLSIYTKRVNRCGYNKWKSYPWMIQKIYPI
jgi:hypothetical protein